MENYTANFTGWEVNRAVVHDGDNVQIWRRRGEHGHVRVFFRSQLAPC